MNNKINIKSIKDEMNEELVNRLIRESGMVRTEIIRSREGRFTMRSMVAGICGDCVDCGNHDTIYYWNFCVQCSDEGKCHLDQGDQGFDE